MSSPWRSLALERADAVIHKAGRLSLRGVFDGEIAHGEIDVVIVAAILDVFEEARDDGHRDHVADVLRGTSAETLAGHADDFALLNAGAAAVPRIDGGGLLDAEV